jgi:hypothetical protein
MIAGMLVLVLLTGMWAYWRSLRDTPQYSVALLIDSARRGDQATVGTLVDTNSVVDDFIPQVTAKAVELYGRGVPVRTIERVSAVAAPLVPAVKDRAREELPRLIRQKSERFDDVPFAGMVLAADRYLDIHFEGELAFVKSKLPQHTFEIKMRRQGEHWQIVGVRDDELAERISRKIGQELMAAASNGSINGASRRLGVENLSDLIQNAEDIFK